MGIVHRGWFESRLRNHHSATSQDDEDPGWYALRNTIYASGCRIMMSADRNFKQSSIAALGYFENALSVHTEILYSRTSIVGVQALTLMVCMIRCICR